MYKSSYAHFHSRVHTKICRIHFSPKLLQYPGTKDTSLPYRQRIYTAGGSLRWREKVSRMIDWEQTLSVCHPQGLTWTGRHWSIILRWRRAANTGKVRSSAPTPDGMYDLFHLGGMAFHFSRSLQKPWRAGQSHIPPDWQVAADTETAD